MQQLQWPSWQICASVVLMFLGCSCASVDYGLYRPGATEDDFSRDETECRRGLGLGGGSVLDPSHILIFFVERYKHDVQTCLQEKGWKPIP